MDSGTATSSSASYDQTVEFVFHNVEYILHAYVQDGALYLEAEQKNNGHRWVGHFPPEYVEEMTHKTGNSKKFPVFVRMLNTALSRNSDSVFIDLLTSADLAMLKARKTGVRPQATDASMAASNQQKRYVILTYVVEFDRVHYPLPLKFEAHPPTEVMQRTILRLRTQLEQERAERFTSSMYDADAGASGAKGGASVAKLKAEHIQLVEENKRLTRELQQIQRTGAGDTDAVRHLQQEVQFLRGDLHEKDRQLLQLQNGGGAPSSTGDAVRLRQTEEQLWKAEEAIAEERELSQRIALKHRKEARALQEDLDESRKVEKALRMHIRSLEGLITRLGGKPPSLPRRAVSSTTNSSVAPSGRASPKATRSRSGSLRSSPRHSSSAARLPSRGRTTSTGSRSRTPTRSPSHAKATSPVSRSPLAKQRSIARLYGTSTASTRAKASGRAGSRSSSRGSSRRGSPGVSPSRSGRNSPVRWSSPSHARKPSGGAKKSSKLKKRTSGGASSGARRVPDTTGVSLVSAGGLQRQLNESYAAQANAEAPDVPDAFVASQMADLSQRISSLQQLLNTSKTNGAKAAWS